jgi:hypothetical protein
MAAIWMWLAHYGPQMPLWHIADESGGNAPWAISGDFLAASEPVSPEIRGDLRPCVP